MQLAELDFIDRSANLVFIGPTGVGKTGLASAILLAALLRRAGFRCALFVFPGHAAVGVEVPHDVPGAYLEREGVRYYYCETTKSGWIVGVMPDDVEVADMTFISIPPWGVDA